MFSSVKYLGLHLSKGACALGEDQIGPILSFLLPQTLKQWKVFLGITGYCRLWILGYGEIACPLYQLIKEPQKNDFSILVWEPEVEKAFKQLKKALLQASALSLPAGQELNLYVTERGKWPWES